MMSAIMRVAAFVIFLTISCAGGVLYLYEMQRTYLPFLIQADLFALGTIVTGALIVGLVAITRGLWWAASGC